MRRFFTDKEDIKGKYSIIEEDANHIIKSLRMEIGQNLLLSSTDGYDYLCKIISFIDGEVELETLSKEKNQTESKTKIHLYQCIPKGSKFEHIIQKSVELGVFEITPVLSEHCVSRPEGKAAERKIERWQKISLEAAKQSGRGIIPKVNSIMKYTDCINTAKEGSEILVFYEKAEFSSKIKNISFNNNKTYSIFIGSEGGFSEIEIDLAKKSRGKILTLGRRILRTETAPIVALSGIFFFLDEF